MWGQVPQTMDQLVKAITGDPVFFTEPSIFPEATCHSETVARETLNKQHGWVLMLISRAAAENKKGVPFSLKDLVAQARVEGLRMSNTTTAYLSLYLRRFMLANVSCMTHETKIGRVYHRIKSDPAANTGYFDFARYGELHNELDRKARIRLTDDMKLREQLILTVKSFIARAPVEGRKQSLKDAIQGIRRKHSISFSNSWVVYWERLFAVDYPELLECVRLHSAPAELELDDIANSFGGVL